MTTWNDLIVTNPPDTEVVSNGAFRIRQVVDAGKTTMAVEHYQTGEHKFPTTQPGTPQDGQIWFDLVNKVIRRTNGTSQDIANAVGVFSSYTATLLNITGNTYASRGDIPNVVVLPGSRVILCATYQGAAASSLTTKWVRDATDVSTKEYISGYGNITTQFVGMSLDLDAPAAGTYTYHIFGKSSTAFMASVFLMALVL